MIKKSKKAVVVLFVGVIALVVGITCAVAGGLEYERNFSDFYQK